MFSYWPITACFQKGLAHMLNTQNVVTVRKFVALIERAESGWYRLDCRIEEWEAGIPGLMEAIHPELPLVQTLANARKMAENYAQLHGFRIQDIEWEIME
jgi:hypothetical protein